MYSQNIFLVNNYQLQKMDIISILKQDYQNFPANQHYDIFAEDFYFEGFFNKFRGIEIYKQMINLYETGFIDTELKLVDIVKSEDIIKTQWILSWTAPFPWKPRVTLPGRSEAKLNADGLISSHIDYLDISHSDLLKQLFQVT